MDKAKSAPIKILGSKEDNYKIFDQFNMSPNAIPNPKSADDHHASTEAIELMKNFIPPSSQAKVTATNKTELEKKPDKKQEEPDNKQEEPDVINGDDYLLWDLDL